MQRLLAALCVILLAACQPIGPIAGGKLSGSAAPAPADWTTFAAVPTVQLETRPGSPYSVNIWGVANGAKYYVAAGSGGKTKWTAFIAADPNVRLRIDKNIYELKAVRVNDATEKKHVGDLYTAKYKLTGDRAAQAGDAWLYRLEPR